MKIKKLGMLALSATFLFALASCDFNKKETPTTLDTTTVVVTDPVSDNEPQVDNKYRIFLLAQSSGFNGTYEEWLESIKGDSITLEIVDGKLKWKYSSEGNDKFRDLLDVSSLKGADGNGIVSVSKKDSVGKIDTYKITFTNGTETEFTVANGQDGEGKAILNLDKTNTNGLIDEYTITFSDATEYKFYVTNGATGATGAAGKSIVSITPGTSSGLVDNYTITFTDGDTFDFTVTNGTNGSNGENGRGIASVTKGTSSGLVDNYTITFTDGDMFDFTVTNGKDADETIVEYSDNGLTKTVYTYSDDSVEKIISAYTNNGWVNKTKVVSTFNTTGVALGTEQVEDREYNWDISEGKWVDTNIVTCYEYSLDGHKLLTKSVYEDDDSVMLLIHIYSYDINGNVIRDYYLKEASGGQFYKYGTEKVYNDELHCITEIHYYWDGADGIDIAKGKTTSYLHQFGSNIPFKYVELYYDITYDTVTNSYEFDLTKCIEQDCDEFGTLIGNPAEQTLDYDSYVYCINAPEYEMIVGNFETTYTGTYIFDMHELCIVPSVYNIDSGNTVTGDLLDKYGYAEYDLYSHSYRSVTIREPEVEEGIVIGASVNKYYNGELVEKNCYVEYTHNDLGLLVEEFWSYDWDNDLQKWTRFERDEITWNADSKPITITGYKQVGDDWVKSYKIVQTWVDDEITETTYYTWDPTANGGEGGWVLPTP